jgi:hypothetical protein
MKKPYWGRRIKSFTIVELVVSLLISSIVISMSYYALIFFNKQYRNYKLKSDGVNSFLLFKKAMQQDMERSPLIIDSGAALIFYKEGKADKMATYSFERKFVVRKTETSKDTFAFENRISKWGYISDSLPLIKNIGMNIKMADVFLACTFNKNYTAKELIAGEKLLHE